MGYCKEKYTVMLFVCHCRCISLCFIAPSGLSFILFYENSSSAMPRLTPVEGRTVWKSYIQESEGMSQCGEEVGIVKVKTIVIFSFI